MMGLDHACLGSLAVACKFLRINTLHCELVSVGRFSGFVLFVSTGLDRSVALQDAPPQGPVAARARRGPDWPVYRIQPAVWLGSGWTNMRLVSISRLLGAIEN